MPRLLINLVGVLRIFIEICVKFKSVIIEDAKLLNHHTKFYIFTIALTVNCIIGCTSIGAAQSQPNNPAHFSPQYLAAVEVINHGKTDQAISMLQRILKDNRPEDRQNFAGITEAIGALYLREGNVRMASSVFLEVISKYPGSDAADDSKRGLIEVAANHIATSGPVNISKSIISAPTISDAVLLAQNLINNTAANGNTMAVGQTAFDAFQHRFGYVPETEFLSYQLVLNYDKASKYKVAFQKLNQLMVFFPESSRKAEYLIQLGFYANLLNNPIDAQGYFNQASKLNPSRALQAKELLGKGISFRDLGDAASARKELSEAAKLASNESDPALIQTINDLMNTGGIKEESKPSLKRVSQSPESVRPFTVCALIFFIVGVIILYRSRKNTKS